MYLSTLLHGFRLPRIALLLTSSVLVVTSATLVRAAEGEFDHSPFDALLKENVSAAGWVDYKNLGSERKTELRAYIRSLGSVNVASLKSRHEKMAFWINAYNAIVIQKLIDHSLPAEVPHARFFGKNIFTESTYRVAGRVRTLDNIEHDILRETFKDNRVHAALVCGASSCPRLRPEAYTGAKLNTQLDEEARRWVQTGVDKKGKRKNRLDRRAKVYYVSKIFDWFEEDFGDSYAGILKFHKRFVSDEDRKFLEKNKVTVRFLSYDWALNKK